MNFGKLLSAVMETAWRSLRRVCTGLFVLMAIAALPAWAAPDSKGTDFWLMFPANYSTPAMTLFITGDTATNGVVTIPGIGFSAPFSTVPGTVTSVVMPSTAEVTAVDSVTDQGIHVVANAEVTVYGLNRLLNSTDAYLGLPTDILGTSYINLGYSNTNIINATQLGIVGTQGSTVVTITPTVQAGARAAGVPFTVTLNQGQTYQLRSTSGAPADLSGTIITATAPIAVFGGHQCANIPNGNVLACDFIVEQLPPTTTWGKAFVTMPLATRRNGDTFRILASTNNTVVSLNGAVIGTINRGQLIDRIIDGPARITASQPVLVAQYSNGTTYDDVTSDPFEMLVPPFEQFLASYTVTTPASGFAINYINIVAPNSAVGNITLDGVAIAPASYTPIGSSGFSGTQVPVTLGSHNLAGSAPFGVFVYGFANADSYGYPGGMSLSQVAVVTTLALTPKTATGPVNAQHCVNATLRDQNSAPVSGVRVDFSVTGANPRTGFVNASAAGVAQYCYTGTVVGTDTIVASVGTLSDSATKIWTAGAVATCDIDRDGDIDMKDILQIRAGVGQLPILGDPRDADGDRRITINDVRACTLQCTRAQCVAN